MMERELDRGLRRRSERCTCLGHVLGHCPDGTIVVGPAIGTPPDQIHPTDGQPSSNLRLRILIVPRARILKVSNMLTQSAVQFIQSSFSTIFSSSCSFATLPAVPFFPREKSDKKLSNDKFEVKLADFAVGN